MSTRSAAAVVDPDAKLQQVDLPFENQEVSVDVGFEQEPEVEVKVEPKKPAKEEEPQLTDLQKQIEALKQAEEINREENARLLRERDEALARSAQYQGEVKVNKLSAEEATLSTIQTAIHSAKSEIEAAKRDLSLSVNSADADGQVEAMDRLATARAYLSKLEDGEIEVKQRIEGMREEPVERVETQQSADPIDRMNIPDRAKEWLREHKEYSTNPRLNAKLTAAHWDALEEGHKAFSTDYFSSVERILGLSEQEPEVEIQEEVERKPQRRTPIVSAPVSRTAPGNSETKPSQVRLTQAEVEHARAAGITPAEYAKQKLKLASAKRDGHYGEY